MIDKTSYPKELETLRQAAINSLDAIREHSRTRRALGHILTDAPVELMHAAGFYPVEILAHHGHPGVSGKHFQSFTCSYSRGSLDVLLDGQMNFLQGVITPFICDTTRCVDIVLRDEKPLPFIECFHIPKALTGPGARDFLIGELKRLKASLEKASGKPVSKDALSNSIKLFNKARGLLRKAQTLRATDPQAYFELCRAFTFTPVEVFIELMEKAGADGNPIHGQTSLSEAQGVPIFLAGKLPEPFDLPDALRTMGARIVGDDLTVGARLFALDVNEKADPIEALADRQLNNIPFACFVLSKEDRADYLVRMARESGAKGVIMMALKFCEIFELDAPEIRERLNREGIPALVLETDIVQNVPGQMKTRIEAFLEMIRHG